MTNESKHCEPKYTHTKLIDNDDMLEKIKLKAN